MEQDQNTKLFMAAFYADLDVLQKTIISEDDMQIKLPLPDGDYKLFWNKCYLEINVLDILNWAAYGFYEYFDEDDLYVIDSFANDNRIIKTCINPSEYYNKVMNCIVWLCDKFSINNYSIKNYSKYRLLRHFMFDDENWLYEDEMNEAIEKGYREIDLNLINEAEKSNGISCYNLIKKGANYKIDPIDFEDESAIVDILGADRSFHKMGMIKYLSDKNKWDESDLYCMLSCLYQVGVSNYILDIVMTNNARI